MHQFELKMKEQFERSVIEIYGMVTYFFSQTVTWSLEDACSLFCLEHLIFKLSCKKHCLFLLPGANKFVFRPLFTQLLLSTFLSQHFSSVFGSTQLSPHPPHPIAFEVRVVLAEHAVCACCTSWPMQSLWSSITRLFFKHCFNRHSLYEWIRLLTFASNCLLHVIMA